MQQLSQPLLLEKYYDTAWGELSLNWKKDNLRCIFPVSRGRCAQKYPVVERNMKQIPGIIKRRQLEEKRFTDYELLISLFLCKKHRDITDIVEKFQDCWEASFQKQQDTQFYDDVSAEDTENDEISSEEDCTTNESQSILDVSYSFTKLSIGFKSDSAIPALQSDISIISSEDPISSTENPRASKKKGRPSYLAPPTIPFERAHSEPPIGSCASRPTSSYGVDFPSQNKNDMNAALALEIKKQLKSAIFMKKKLGYVYVLYRPAFINASSGGVKVGFSKNPVKRVKDLKSCCGIAELEIVYHSPEIPNYDKVEKLAKINLQNHQMGVKCGKGANHTEWFEVAPIDAENAVKRWMKFMLSEPYYLESGSLKEKYFHRADQLCRINDGDMALEMMLGASEKNEDVTNGDDRRQARRSRVSLPS